MHRISTIVNPFCKMRARAKETIAAGTGMAPVRAEGAPAGTREARVGFSEASAGEVRARRVRGAAGAIGWTAGMLTVAIMMLLPARSASAQIANDFFWLDNYASVDASSSLGDSGHNDTIITPVNGIDDPNRIISYFAVSMPRNVVTNAANFYRFPAPQSHGTDCSTGWNYNGLLPGGVPDPATHTFSITVVQRHVFRITRAHDINLINATPDIVPFSAALIEHGTYSGGVFTPTPGPGIDFLTTTTAILPPGDYRFRVEYSGSFEANAGFYRINGCNWRIGHVPEPEVGWTQRAVSGPSPSSLPAMANDTIRGTTVLFGGYNGSTLSGETWEWNGIAWTQWMLSGPSPRNHHAMAYDSARGVTVLFGGYTGSYSGETWEWNGTAWTQRMVSGPSPRVGHTMAYDSARGVTVLFGGYDANEVRNGETWEFNGNTWTQRLVSGPSPRNGHAMVYDSARGVTVLFGGSNGSTDNGQTWEWNGTVWTQRAVSGPSPREYHAMVYDSMHGVTVLFGGYNGAAPNGELWQWNGTAWAQQAFTGPTARYVHEMTYDCARDVTVLFGGFNGSAYFAQTWEFHGPTINAPPMICVQPVTQSVCPGSGVSLSVAAAGTPLPTYQWRRNGAIISGATSPTLTINPAVQGTTGSYTVDVANSNGTVTSIPAGINVAPPPIAYASASPNPGPHLAPVTFTINVCPNCPTLSVTADLRPIGGIAAQAFRDDGMAGDPVAGDGMYSCRFTPGVPLVAGVYSLPFTVTAPLGVTVTDTIDWVYSLAPQTTDLGYIFSQTVNVPTQALSAGQVRWFSFQVGNRIAPNAAFLDIDTEGSLFDTEIGLYSDTGTLVATDDNSGSGSLSQLTFGCGTRPAIGNGQPYDGRNGNLSPATYYLAVGGAGTTFGATGWNVTSNSNIGGSYRFTINSAACPNTSPNGCCNAREWRSLAIGVPPTARSGHAMCYDSTANRMVMFGGLPLNAETWELSGARWYQVPTGGPSARSSHVMAYDPVRDRTVLFGGASASTVFGDTWEWNGIHWTRVATTGPSPRRDAAMVYSPINNGMLLFGGSNGTDPLGETWLWNGTTWTLLANTGPMDRYDHSMVFDLANGRAVLFGGRGGHGKPTSDLLTWEWNGTTWTSVGGTGPQARYDAMMAYDSACGQVTLIGGRAFAGTPGAFLADAWTRANGVWVPAATPAITPRSEAAFVYDNVLDRFVLFGGRIDSGGGSTSPVNDTWQLGCPCGGEDAAPLDASGNPIFPPDLDPTEPVTVSDIECDAGLVADLYPGMDTTTEDWYSTDPCNPSIGGTIPPEASSPNMDAQVTEYLRSWDPTMPPVSADEIAQAVNAWNVTAGEQAKTMPDPLLTLPPVPGPYVPPVTPYEPDPALCYAFDGADIVYVHGIRVNPLMNAILHIDPQHAFTTWPDDEREFYNDLNGDGYYGYWKRGADAYWTDDLGSGQTTNGHVEHFLKGKGYSNRYLIVAYPATQHVGIGAHAVLSQIARAMHSGQGVVDPGHPGNEDHTKFGSKRLIIISHSMGGLVTDVAMAAGARNPSLQAQFITNRVKAHITFNDAIDGAQVVTAIMVCVDLIKHINVSLPPWVCPLIKAVAFVLNDVAGYNVPGLICFPDVGILNKSSLVDLIPAVAQTYWGLRYTRHTPVPTVIIAGAHPTFIAPIKWIVEPGFGDGAPNLDGQNATPNPSLFWPGRYIPVWGPYGFPLVFDMGLFRSGVGSRAIGYFIDQTYVGSSLSPFPLFPISAAAGSTPYLSPSGMRQPVGLIGIGGLFDSRNRKPNHISFIMNTGDHFTPSSGLGDHHSFNAYYRNSFGERNWEEVRAIVGNQIYDHTYTPAGDYGALLEHTAAPAMKEILRGKKLTFTIKIFGKKFTKSWWIWRRKYHVMVDSETKISGDYVYDSLLRTQPPCSNPVTIVDCNGNGIPDYEDLATGLLRDCDHNGIPDECEGHTGPVIMQQPVSVSVHAGDEARFTVSANGTPPFAYQWRRNGVNLVDGPSVFGSRSALLRIRPAAAGDAGTYTVVVTSRFCPADGVQTSAGAVLSVLRPGDFNGDGRISSQDFFDFISAFFSLSPTADFNHDGVISSQDFFDFLTAFFAG